jgi:hypothetical protein
VVVVGVLSHLPGAPMVARGLRRASSTSSSSSGVGDVQGASASGTCSSWLPWWCGECSFLVIAVPIRPEWSFPLVAIRRRAQLHTGLLG